MVLDPRALSALVDGELDDVESQRAIDQLLDDFDARRRLSAYCATADALRTPRPAPFDEVRFRARFGAAFERELPYAAGVRPRTSRRSDPSPARWWRIGVPGLAIAASVFAMSWVVAPSVWAPSDTTINPGTRVAVEIPALREYLLAHQQYAPATRMQGVAPYVRTVAFDRGVGVEPGESAPGVDVR